MSFPLIQDQGPLQELAAVLGRIRDRHLAAQQVAFERQIALADEARKNKYLTLSQEEAAATQRHNAALETHAAQELALQQAQLGATIKNQAAERMAQALTRKQALVGMILRNLPDGVTMSLARAQQEAAGNRYLPGVSAVPPTAAQDMATAQSRSIYGRQGSVLRNPVSGSANGITFTPPTLNSNAPAAGGRGTPAERVAGVQADNVERSITNMESIARDHPRDAQTALAIIHGQELHGKIGSAINFLRGAPSQAAQDFISEWGNFQLATTPLYGGSRPTVQLLGLERLASAPAIGADDFTIPFGHMRDRIRELRAKAGQQAPPTGPAIDPRFLPGRRR